VTLRSVQVKSVLPRAYTTVANVVGQTLTVQRVAGDQITKDMVGSSAQNALASALPEDERAIAVHVDRAQGMAGLLRPGDHVSVIAVLDPQQVGSTFGFQAPEQAPAGNSAGLSQQSTVPEGPMAKLTLTGLRVLFVPWEFRYQEITPSGDDNSFMAPIMTSQQGQNNGVVVLAAPVTPITVTWKAATEPLTPTTEIHETGQITAAHRLSDTGKAKTAPKQSDVGQSELEPEMTISPVELLALLDDTDAEIHLVLEPAQQKQAVHTVGVTLGNLLARQQEADLLQQQPQEQPPR